MPAKVTFGDYEFSSTGVPQFGMRDQAEGDSVVNRIVRTTIDVKQIFEESSFADNSARIAQLREALALGEGRLRILDENDQVIFDRVVKVRDSDVPQEWRQNISEVNVSFECRRQEGVDSSSATFTPNGGTPVILANVREYKQGVQTERVSAERDSRRITTARISMSGRVLADETLSVANRRTALQLIAQQMRGCDAKNGTLVFGSDTFTCRVESIEVDLGDGSDAIEWSLVATFQQFPDGEFAHAEFEVDERLDAEKSERRLLLRGSVRSLTESAARAKVEEIKSRFSGGKALLGESIVPGYSDGPDGEEYISLNFSVEWRHPDSGVLKWELKITTKEDIRNANNIITYEVTVYGSSSSAALNKARALGRNKGNFPTNTSEVIATRQRDGESEYLVEVQAAYEYYRPNTDYEFAEVRTEDVRDPYGEYRRVVSGYVAANSESWALSIARTFQTKGSLRDSRESTTTQRVNSTTRLDRVEFTYVHYLSRTSASIAYSKEEIIDDESGEQLIVYSGQAFGNTRAACDAVINAVVGGGTRLRRSRTENREGSHLVSVNFSETYRVGSAVAIVTEAEVTVTRAASLQRTIITPVPFGDPVVQQNVGRIPGRATVTGSCVAATRGTVTAFMNSAKSKLPGGGYMVTSQESVAEIFRKVTGLPVGYRAQFTFEAEYPSLS